jgi:hypothetical protein
MKMKKQERAEIECRTFNGVEGFWPYARKEGWWIYRGREPMSVCIVILQGDSVEIHQVVVHDKTDRRKGLGTAMIADIRLAFPDKHIWVDTWTHSRPFWQRMIEFGYIDSIENDYAWPCFDTTCRVCHPNRSEGRRRFQ